MLPPKGATPTGAGERDGEGAGTTGTKIKTKFGHKTEEKKL